MSGIEILNQTKYYSLSDISWILIGLTGLFFVLMFVFLINSERNVCNTLSYVSFGMAALCFLGVILTAILVKQPSKAYQQYQVTISDQVNFKEFNNKYEVIEQEGQIYTIVERNK